MGFEMSCSASRSSALLRASSRQETLQPTSQEGASSAALPAIHNSCFIKGKVLQRDADSADGVQALRRHVMIALAIHQAIRLAGGCQHLNCDGHNTLKIHVALGASRLSGKVYSCCQEWVVFAELPWAQSLALCLVRFTIGLIVPCLA